MLSAIFKTFGWLDWLIVSFTIFGVLIEIWMWGKSKLRSIFSKPECKSCGNVDPFCSCTMFGTDVVSRHTGLGE